MYYWCKGLAECLRPSRHLASSYVYWFARRFTATTRSIAPDMAMPRRAPGGAGGGDGGGGGGGGEGGGGLGGGEGGVGEGGGNGGGGEGEIRHESTMVLKPVHHSHQLVL